MESPGRPRGVKTMRLSVCFPVCVSMLSIFVQSVVYICIYVFVCVFSLFSYFIENIARLLLVPVRDKLEARLRDKREMYKDLAMSDALARELRRVPEEEQTTKVRTCLFSSAFSRLQKARRRCYFTRSFPILCLTSVPPSANV